MRSRSFLHQLLRGTSLLVMLAGFLLAGCSDRASPLATDASQRAKRAFTPETFTPVSVTTTTPQGVLKKPITATKMITAAKGGTVKIEGDTYEYSLRFPAGALDQDTEVSMTVPNPGEALFEIEFQPHGLYFNKTVTLKIELKEVALEVELTSLDIFYYNEETGLWESQGAKVEVEDDEIEAKGKLEHFSRYALGGD